MKYDDASWHYGGDFPEDLPDEAGATHTGMYLAWALLTGLASSMHTEDFPDTIPPLQRRQITPGRFFLEYCDGKFIDDDLNDLGNEYTQAYFDFDKGEYLADYEKILGAELPTLYHVEDSWRNYDRLRPHLDRRFASWKRMRALRSLIPW